MSIKFDSKTEGTVFFKCLPFEKVTLFFRMLHGKFNFQCHSNPWKWMKYVVRKNYFLYQPMYFCNLPRKDDYQTDYFLQKYLLCLISYLALYFLLLETEPGTETFLALAAHKCCWCLCWREIFGLALQAHSSPWRSTLCQLSLSTQGCPPPTSTGTPVCSSLVLTAFPPVVWFRGFGVSLSWKITFVLHL